MSDVRQWVRAANFAFVKRVGVIENKNRTNISLFQVRQKLLVPGPIVLSLFAFRAGPGEVHADKFDPGSSDEVEVLFVAGDKMDVHPYARGKNRFWNFSRAAQRRQQ